MRLLLAVAVLSAALACSEKAPAEPAGPREHPLAQDGTVVRATTSTPDRVRVQLDLAAARGAIQVYRGEHQAWPADLAALRLEGISYPKDLAYDPATGTVRSLTYPSY